MMLPNRCSFSAHQRMHKNRPPHVCPECGGNFLQTNFQTHLREACLHFSRRVGYRCSCLLARSLARPPTLPCPWCQPGAGCASRELPGSAQPAERPLETCPSPPPLPQVPKLFGGVRRRELHQVPHPDVPLRGVPQVSHLPHGLQVCPQRPRPPLHPAPQLPHAAGQVRAGAGWVGGSRGLGSSRERPPH